MNNTLPKMQLNKITQNIPQAMSIYINQLVYEQKRKGYDITTLSLGEAYFNIPLFDFKKLDVEKCYHYSESQGLPELRMKIAEYYKSFYNTEIDYKKELLISAGSKPLIFMAMQAVLNQGDEALILEPAWLSYQEQLRLVGAEPKFIPYNCKIEDINKYFTKNTKMLIINNPNNPAGWLYSKEDLLSIYKQCRKCGIYVLVDEAYSDFIVEDKNFYSMANVVPDKDGIIVINSLSKNMGMSGFRVGYVISSETVIEQILKLNQHIITCAPTILLHYLTRYFEQIIEITLPQVKNIVKQRNKIADFMNKLEMNHLQGGCTFYFFVSIEDFPASSLDFAMCLLLKYNVAVVPGGAYGESTERFIRISIGTESMERIYDALMIISSLIKLKKFDKNKLNEMLIENNVKPLVVVTT